MIKLLQPAIGGWDVLTSGETERERWTYISGEGLDISSMRQLSALLVQ